MKKKLILLIMSVILLCVITILYFFVLPPITLTIIGNEKVYLKINEEYKEEGCTATLFGKDITDQIVISGEVNTSVIDTYKITCSVKKGLKEAKKVRKVQVLDDISPTLTLKGSSYIYLYKGKEYTEYGYDVSDNYDQQINVKVTSNLDVNKVGKYEIKYSAIDSSSNKVEVTRTIEVVEEPLAKNVPVLMYHFFYDASKGEKAPDSNYTEVSAFEEQIKYLVDNNYYFPTWDEINDYLDEKIALPDKSIVLTFDDGAPTFYDIAYPVIAKYNVPVTVFLITSWGPPNNIDFPLVSFQSHSHDMHRGGCNTGHGGIFQCIDEEEAIEDLITSKQIANDATIFCYPFGDVNDREVTLLKEANFIMAFTTQGGRIEPGMDKYKLPRVRISGGISLAYFKQLVA